MKLNLVFSDNAWEDYTYWQNNDEKIAFGDDLKRFSAPGWRYTFLRGKKIVQRINLLIKEIIRTPRAGIGKPEPLKYGLSGYWSRRINDEHRIVYKVDSDNLYIAQLRYHY